MRKFIIPLVAVFFLSSIVLGQNFEVGSTEEGLKKARAIIAKSIERLGGEKYLGVRTSIGEGKFSQLKDGVNVSFQSFIDVIVLPNTERTDFIDGSIKTVQVNTGDTGWIYEEFYESLRDQNEKGIEGFKTSLRNHFDYLLRADWKDEARVTYEGRRRASLGKRNDVLKLTFIDGFEVEYEFSDDGTPMKTIYKRFEAEEKEVVEETRYEQFLTEQGISTPFVVDRYTDGVHAYRVNYESVTYNQPIPHEIFVKPDDPKKLRKKLKL